MTPTFGITFTNTEPRSDPPVTTVFLVSERVVAGNRVACVPYHGVVDTGADRCMLPVDAARQAGLDLQPWPHRSLSTAGGAMVVVVRRPCRVVVFGQVVDVEIDFGPRRTAPLIGRNAMAAATSAIALDDHRLLYAARGRFSPQRGSDWTIRCRAK